MAHHRMWEAFPREHWGPQVLHYAFWVIVLVALIALTVWLVRSARQPGGTGAATPLPPARPAIDPALEEARMRYARGEMSREDYLQIAADLSGRSPEAPPA